MGEIVEAVQMASKPVEPHKLNDTILMYRIVLERALNLRGGNNFAEPHLQKAHGRRSGKNVETVFCDVKIYNEITSHLRGHFHVNVMNM